MGELQFRRRRYRPEMRPGRSVNLIDLIFHDIEIAVVGVGLPSEDIMYSALESDRFEIFWPAAFAGG